MMRMEYPWTDTTDALVVPWDHFWLVDAFQPFKLLPWLLWSIMATGILVILMAPDWPCHPPMHICDTLGYRSSLVSSSLRGSHVPRADFLPSFPTSGLLACVLKARFLGTGLSAAINPTLLKSWFPSTILPGRLPLHGSSLQLPLTNTLFWWLEFWPTPMAVDQYLPWAYVFLGVCHIAIPQCISSMTQ